MWYSCLSRYLPETVEIAGQKYGIQFGYRTMIAIEMLMYKNLSNEDRIQRSLYLFYNNNIPENIDEAIEKLLWFYNCGTGGYTRNESHSSSRRQQQRAYDFEQDAGMIYAAFKQQYNINLHEIASKDLHWWEFSALFENLTDDTKMAKVMYWRTCDLNGMSKAEQRYVKKMREIYAIQEINTGMDAKTRLSKRNADMVGYIRRRYEECEIG